MPTRNISLTAEQDAFIDQIVKSGEYQNASEAMRDALRTLQQKRQEDEIRLNLLRAELKAGLRALEDGDFVELNPRELEEYISAIAAGRRKRKR